MRAFLKGKPVMGWGDGGVEPWSHEDNLPMLDNLPKQFIPSGVIKVMKHNCAIMMCTDVMKFIHTLCLLFNP